MSNEEFIYSTGKKAGSFSFSKGIKVSTWEHNEHQKTGDYSVNIGIKTPSWNFTYPEIDLNRECRDIDGNVYETVKIGNQVWMAENLKVTHYRNGDEIPNVTDATEWTNLSTGAYVVNPEEYANAVIYGYLYNGFVVADDRGICPEGWRIPTDDEWKELEGTVDSTYGVGDSEWDGVGFNGNNIGSKLAARADLWDDGDLENNAEFGTSGFNLLPGGLRSNTGQFQKLNDHGYFWSSTEDEGGVTPDDLWFRALKFNNPKIFRSNVSKPTGMYMRCIWDGQVPSQKWAYTWDWVFSKSFDNIEDNNWEDWG